MDRKKFSMEEFFGDLTMFCKDFEVESGGGRREEREGGGRREVEGRRWKGEKRVGREGGRERREEGRGEGVHVYRSQCGQFTQRFASCFVLTSCGQTPCSTGHGPPCSGEAAGERHTRCKWLMKSPLPPSSTLHTISTEPLLLMWWGTVPLQCLNANDEMRFLNISLRACIPCACEGIRR